MATLRDLIGVNTDSGLAAQLQDQDRAAGMGSVAKSWASGRIGTDANALAAEEVGLRASGDVAGADTLRGQIGALQQRQQMYAPEVGRVEDIGWNPGRAASWLGTQVGQGAASMLDPLAVGAAVGGASRLIGAIPHPLAQGVSRVGQAAALGLPFLMNQRQMTGEFVNDAARDPELMARTSPTDLRNAANIYGAGAGALDTVLPHMIGKQLTGAGLRKGLSSTGPGLKTLGGMAMEGTTELAQGKASQFTQGLLNPNRDTSGDFSDDLNNFAGGAAGSSPLAAAGAYADAGYRRVGNTAERLGTAAGQGFDLAAEKAAPYIGQAKEAGSKWWKRGSEAATDLATGEDGKVSASALAGNLKAGAQDAAATFSMPKEERAILELAMPQALAADDKTPDGITKARAWMQENEAKRAQMVATKLGEMAGNDPEAKALLDNIMTAQESGAAQEPGFDAGAEFLLKRTDLNQLNDKMNQAGSALGRVSGVAGAALGRGAATLGKGAFKFGEAVVGGVKQGLSKKNMQTLDPQGPLDAIKAAQDSIAGADTFKAWRDRVYDRGEGPVKSPEQQGSEQSYRRAQLFGEMMASAAKDIPATPTTDAKSTEGYMRDMGFEIADLADSWAQHAEGKAVRGEQAKRQAPGMVIALDGIANDLRVAHGDNAQSVLDEMQAMAEPSAAPMFDHLREALATSGTKVGRKSMQERRTNAANQLLTMLPTERAAEVIRSGKDGKHELLSSLEAFSRGHADPGMRKGLEQAVGGRDALNKMLEVVSGISAPEPKVGTVVDDRAQSKSEENLDPNADDAQDGESSAYEQAAAEKNVRNSANRTVYAFGSGLEPRSGTERDPFYHTEKVDKKTKLAREVAGESGALRPNLFKPGEKAFNDKTGKYDGPDLIRQRTKKLVKQMGIPTEPDINGRVDEDGDLIMEPTEHAVGPKSAHDVMKSLNMQPGSILALHRDYLRQDAAAESRREDNLTPAQRNALQVQAGAVAKVLQKLVRQAKRPTAEDIKKMTPAEHAAYVAKEAAAPKQSINERKTLSEMRKRMLAEGGDATMSLDELEVADALAKAKDYFSQRHVVVANQMTNAVPEQITYPQLREMHAMGERSLSFARKQSLVDGEVDEAKHDELVSQANILMFPPPAGGKESDGFSIPAGKLVKWVIEQRGKFEKEGKEKSLSDAQKNDAYRKDVAAGVAAIMNSGLSSGWPYKLNEGGERESFADGTPPSLYLRTSNESKDQSTLAEKRAKQQAQHGQGDLQKFQGPDQEKVAIDQARNEEEFVADPLMEREPNNKKTARQLDVTRSTDSAGDYLTADRSGQRDVEHKSDDLNATEIDFSKGQDPKAEKDEISDLKYRTEQSMAAFELPKSKLGAMRAAERSAEIISSQMMDDPRMARDTIMSHIRVALQEGGYNKNGTVGDAYHIAPIIDLVSPANLAKFVKRGAQPNLVDGMKRAALTVLIRGAEGRNDISDSHLTALAAKLGVPGDLKGMQDELHKRGVLNLKQLEQYVSPKNPDAPMLDVSSKPLGRNVRDAGRQEELFHEGVDGKSLYKRTPNQVKGAPGESSRTVSQEFVDRQTVKAKARPGPYTEQNTERDTSQMDLVDPKPTSMRAKREVAAGLGKPSGGVELGGTGQYAAKDQAKADQATKFIGRGSAASSTAKYAKAFGSRANTGSYSSNDTVFISAEGNRTGRVNPDAAEIAKAMDAGATIVTDNQADRTRMYNVGERQVAAQLADGGYAEAKPGLWVPAKEKHNAQSGGPSRVATQADMDQAKAYVDKVFGKDGVKLDFQAITGHSGEFIDTTNTIVISTTAAAGTLGTLYHEAMHKFFAQYIQSNPKLQTVFEDLVNDPKHLARLHALLDGYPAAQAQLTSGEERLAYTYQFWKAGLLQVDAKATTWMQKVGKFFRRIAGKVRASERALEIFQAFDNGKMSEPSAAGRVIAAVLGKGTTSIKMRRQFDGLMQAVAAATMPAAEILGKSVSPKARALSTMLFTNPGDGEHGDKGTGLMNARTTMAKQFINRATSRFETMSETDQAQVQTYLQKETDPAKIANPEHRQAVQEIKALLGEFHGYMVKAGMKIGKIENYYPTVWNGNTLLEKKDEFINMLVMNYANEMRAIKPGVDTKMKNLPPSAYSPKDAATRIWQSLVDRDGVDAHLPAGREDGVLNPFFAGQESRTLPWLRGEHKEAFLEKDMAKTLTRYFSQGTKATEYFRRFGADGTRLDDMLNGTKELGAQGFPVRDAKDEYTRAADGIIHELKNAANEMGRRGDLKDLAAQAKWVSRQMRDISMSVGAMEGSLGKDVSPGMRKFNSWMTVYQNVRLLPMSLFSSFVDPLAIVARGAPLQAAYETFTYGLREVFHGWADAFKDMPAERQKDEWRELAEHVGAAEVAMFAHNSAEQYGSIYMSSGAKKINDKMFVLNGMEAWNRSNRIMATKWATRFIEKQVTQPDASHSERWLKELGLTPDMIVLDEGKLVTNREQLAALKGITVEQAERQLAPIYQALNRWVEGAVLTPNAAQRPAWSSDPNYATMFHLKQFSYSFHQTILKRATNEFKHGNMAPVGALAMFIPTMIGADLMKGLIQGAGSLPPYMAGMNAGDWVMHGVQRAGLSGIGVIGVDAAADLSSLGGPAIEQAVDALRDGFGAKTGLQALPLHALYGQALK